MADTKTKVTIEKHSAVPPKPPVAPKNPPKKK